MYSQFRVDDWNESKARSLLKRYEDKYNGHFLLVKETGTESGKSHLQGFCHHTASDNTYRQFFNRSYSEHGTKGKCFTRVKDDEVYVAYIINNEDKPDVMYSDVITNYTEDQFNLMKERRRFVRPKRIDKRKMADLLYPIIEEQCVQDGIIDYPMIPAVLIQNLHHFNAVDEFLIKRRAYSYAVKLEYKYPQNSRARSRLYHRVCDLDGDVGIFQTDKFSYLKFEDINKNGELQEEATSETQAEESVQEAWSPVSSASRKTDYDPS